MKMLSARVGEIAILCATVAISSCTSVSDDPPRKATPVQTASVRSAVIGEASLPATLSSRLGKACGLALPKGVEGVLYGPKGLPADQARPRPVIVRSKRHAFQAAEGRIALARSGKGASTTVGDRANAPTRLMSADTKMEVAVSLRGATSAHVVVSDGMLVYPGGHPDADIVHRETGDGAEDWLLFPKAPAASYVEYDVALSRGVASVRNVGNTVELLDTAGTPRLRMAPPYIVGDDCKVTEATVTVTGCATDRSPQLPFGRPHPTPGATSCRIAVSWPTAGVAYPAMLDPEWSSAASMATARAYHTATILNGSPDRVLVVGGLGPGSYNVLNSAEVYDPTTDTWAAYGTMTTARYAHAAMRFGSDGSIMVAGGLDYAGVPTPTVEAHDGMGFSSRASMPGAAAGFTLDPIASDWGIAAGGYRLISGSFRTVISDNYSCRSTTTTSAGWRSS